MITKPTLLILGAGSSNPYGFPLGYELKNKIIKELNYMLDNNPKRIYELGFDKDLISDFVLKFTNTPRPSIDSFLAHQKKEFEEIGKFSIVEIIAKKENETLLSKNKDDDWYTYLVNSLFDCSFDEINKNNISIISYNYDRSLETFLHYSMLTSYKEGEFPEKCVDKLKEIPILHMYGRLDPLPWENKLGRGYGKECSDTDLIKISENIKLVHETKEDNTIKKANELINDANKIYFLGLDLRNKENLEILDLSLIDKKHIICTGFGLKKGEINIIKQFLANKGSYPKIIPFKSLETIRSTTPFE